MQLIEVIQKSPQLNVIYWILISICEFLIICFLLIKILRKSKKDDFYVDSNVTEFKNAEVDLNNVFNSMFNSKNLYDILKRKIHPDKFPNDVDQFNIASELATLLNEHKNNFAKLNEIKSIAEEKLGLTF